MMGSGWKQPVGAASTARKTAAIIAALAITIIGLASPVVVTKAHADSTNNSDPYSHTIWQIAEPIPLGFATDPEDVKNSKPGCAPAWNEFYFGDGELQLPKTVKQNAEIHRQFVGIEDGLITTKWRIVFTPKYEVVRTDGEWHGSNDHMGIAITKNYQVVGPVMVDTSHKDSDGIIHHAVVALKMPQPGELWNVNNLGQVGDVDGSVSTSAAPDLNDFTQLLVSWNDPNTTKTGQTYQRFFRGYRFRERTTAAYAFQANDPNTASPNLFEDADGYKARYPEADFSSGVGILSKGSDTAFTLEFTTKGRVPDPGQKFSGVALSYYSNVGFAGHTHLRFRLVRGAEYTTVQSVPVKYSETFKFKQPGDYEIAPRKVQLSADVYDGQRLENSATSNYSRRYLGSLELPKTLVHANNATATGNAESEFYYRTRVASCAPSDTYNLDELKKMFLSGKDEGDESIPPDKYNSYPLIDKFNLDSQFPGGFSTVPNGDGTNGLYGSLAMSPAYTAGPDVKPLNPPFDAKNSEITVDKPQKIVGNDVTVTFIPRDTKGKQMALDGLPDTVTVTVPGVDGEQTLIKQTTGAAAGTYTGTFTTTKVEQGKAVIAKDPGGELVGAQNTPGAPFQTIDFAATGTPQPIWVWNKTVINGQLKHDGKITNAAAVTGITTKPPAAIAKGSAGTPQYLSDDSLTLTGATARLSAVADVPPAQWQSPELANSDYYLAYYPVTITNSSPSTTNPVVKRTKTVEVPVYVLKDSNGDGHMNNDHGGCTALKKQGVIPASIECELPQIKEPLMNDWVWNGDNFDGVHHRGIYFLSKDPTPRNTVYHIDPTFKAPAWLKNFGILQPGKAGMHNQEVKGYVDIPEPGATGGSASSAQDQIAWKPSEDFRELIVPIDGEASGYKPSKINFHLYVLRDTDGDGAMDNFNGGCTKLTTAHPKSTDADLLEPVVPPKQVKCDTDDDNDGIPNVGEKVDGVWFDADSQPKTFNKLSAKGANAHKVTDDKALPATIMPSAVRGYADVMTLGINKPDATAKIVSGALPPGVTMNAKGRFSGTPLVFKRGDKATDRKFRVKVQVTMPPNQLAGAGGSGVTGASGGAAIPKPSELIDTFVTFDVMNPIGAVTHENDGVVPVAKHKAAPVAHKEVAPKAVMHTATPHSAAPHSALQLGALHKVVRHQMVELKPKQNTVREVRQAYEEGQVRQVAKLGYAASGLPDTGIDATGLLAYVLAGLILATSGLGLMRWRQR